MQAILEYLTKEQLISLIIELKKIIKDQAEETSKEIREWDKYLDADNTP